jgi:pyridoxal phosphate enzyme (YggS family)
MTDLAANLEIVRERIAIAAAEAGCSPDHVTLIAVTKTVPILRIREAADAGVRHFGENRVQEALAKFAGPPKTSQRDVYGGDKVARQAITLHMIGSLQRNKARAAISLFDMIHSVDRVELAQALEKEAALSGNIDRVAFPVLIEVNVSGEASKSGVRPEKLSELAGALAGCKHLSGAGLMTIASFGATEAEVRSTFARLRELIEGLRRNIPGDWKHLSMGMSDDYEYAIREGATMIRLGRSLFGERQKKV